MAGGGHNTVTSKPLAASGGAFSVSIPKSMAGPTAQAAKALGITRAQLVKRALADLLADIQDMKIIEERRKEHSIPHDEFWKKVGLEG